MKINKLCFFTSAIIATMIAPALADIASDTESATCDSGTIGVSSGSTILEAQWTAQQIQCSAGQYLESDTAQCTACPAGSYCEGDTYTFNGTDLGITGACESGYTTDGSAAAQSDCYRTCTTNDIAHSTAVSGKYYYGGNNQCTPTDCAAGYTPRTAFDFSMVYDLSAGQTSFRYKSNTGTGLNSDDTTGLENGEWENTFSYGIVKGQARCSTETGTNNNWTWSDPTTFANLTDETGEEGAQYCYCNVTGFKASGSDSFVSLSSSWVFRSFNYSASDCASYCAVYCASSVGDYAGFRSALFGAVQPTSPSCEANTIGITWKPQNGEANTVNQCTYDGAVTIPETPSRIGYDFNGWKVNNAD